MSKDSSKELTEKIQRLVVGLASSGDNFRVSGTPPAVDSKTIDEYCNSFQQLITTELEMARIADTIRFTDIQAIFKRYSVREYVKAYQWAVMNNKQDIRIPIVYDSTVYDVEAQYLFSQLQPKEESERETKAMELLGDRWEDFKEYVDGNDYWDMHDVERYLNR